MIKKYYMLKKCMSKKCMSKKLDYIVTLLPGSGMGSAFLSILAGLYYLKTNNINNILFVNTYHASKPVEIFILNFLNKKKIKSINFININYNYTPIYNINNKYKELSFSPETTDIYNWLVNESLDFNIFSELFYSFFILNDNINNELIKLEKYDVCINIRRGDKVTLESHINVVSVNEYINEIEKININSPKIFHTSDDYNTFLEIKNIKKDWDINTFCLPDENGFFLSELNKKSDEFNIIHINKFMKELYIMKNSKYFIGSLSTTVGHIVMLLRNKRTDSNNIYL
jgi:hypothetical protein